MKEAPPNPRKNFLTEGSKLNYLFSALGKLSTVLLRGVLARVGALSGLFFGGERFSHLAQSAS